jgi:hypothetical protein
MIHVCNIHCHTLDIEKAELMGLEDRGQWMGFAFHLDVVVACKLTSLDEDSLTYNCTTVFTEHGDTYIIDTPYHKFQNLFIQHHAVVPTEEQDNSSDLNF